MLKSLQLCSFQSKHNKTISQTNVYKMNFRFFTRFVGPSDSKQQQNKNMKKIFSRLNVFFLLLTAPREKEKLNWAEAKYFLWIILKFFFHCVCAVKAILCTWQCLHTKKQKRLIRRECKTFLIFLLDSHVVASLSLLRCTIDFLLCWWMKWEKRLNALCGTWELNFELYWMEM